MYNHFNKSRFSSRKLLENSHFIKTLAPSNSKTKLNEIIVNVDVNTDFGVIHEFLLRTGENDNG